MVPSIQLWLAEAPWMELLALLIDVTLKAAVICAVAGVVTLSLRRSSAFVRNMVWVFALVGLLLLPAFSLFSPVWNLPIIPELSSWGVTAYNADYAKPDQDTSTGLTAAAPLGISKTTGRSDTAPIRIPWYGWIILAWIAGGAFYLCWWLISHAGIRLIVRQASPVRYEWNQLLGSVSEELDLRRRVRLLETERIKAAITFGVFDPVVVLPSDSHEWTENRRRLVLSHELAHVKRWDTLIEALALLVTAFHWFNPFVWFAVRQLRVERERDCDNAVLGTGAKPSDYAELLMNIAADLGDTGTPVWQLSTISQSSNLKDRLMSILNQKINRNTGSRRSAILTGVFVMTLVLSISASGLWSRQSVQTEDKAKQEEKAKTDEAKRKEHEAQKKQADTKKKKMSADQKVTQKWAEICEAGNSAACEVAKVMKKKGPDAGVEKFYSLKKAENSKFRFDEKEFNTAGYVFLFHGKTKEAIAIFELNVKQYPDSWNVYDSLGEAYAAAERYDEAIRNYETAVKMNPESEHSQKALQKLKSIQKTSS